MEDWTEDDRKTKKEKKKNKKKGKRDMTIICLQGKLYAGPEPDSSSSIRLFMLGFRQSSRMSSKWLSKSTMLWYAFCSMRLETTCTEGTPPSRHLEMKRRNNWRQPNVCLFVFFNAKKKIHFWGYFSFEWMACRHPKGGLHAYVIIHTLFCHPVQSFCG